jgi:hypothetical protein
MGFNMATALTDCDLRHDGDSLPEEYSTLMVWLCVEMSLQFREKDQAEFKMEQFFPRVCEASYARPE